jgi:hypothetical protein
MEESQRKVVTESEILSFACRKCHVIAGVGCKRADRTPLTHAIEDTELAFHRERIMDAWASQTNKCMGRLSATDKALIVYYAFVMICDSVSTKAEEVLGKEFSSEQIQKFFASEAIKELRKDRLIE